MSATLQIAATCLYGLVAAISLVMALKSLRAVELLPFQQKAAARTWDEIGGGLQVVVTSLLRLSGLGFLLVGLQLAVAAIVGNLHRDLVVTLALPLLALLFCAGLCVVNLQLHRRTAAETPWRGSLYAAIAVALGVVLSVLR